MQRAPHHLHTTIIITIMIITIIIIIIIITTTVVIIITTTISITLIINIIIISSIIITIIMTLHSKSVFSRKLRARISSPARKHTQEQAFHSYVNTRTGRSITFGHLLTTWGLEPWAGKQPKSRRSSWRLLMGQLLTVQPAPQQRAYVDLRQASYASKVMGRGIPKACSVRKRLLQTVLAFRQAQNMPFSWSLAFLW